jgi:hypothetical protein
MSDVKTGAVRLSSLELTEEINHNTHKRTSLNVLQGEIH